MKKTTKKTYSIREAVAATGFCRAMISRLCQRGAIGKRLESQEFGQFCYRLSAADLRTLKNRRKTFKKNTHKTDR